MRVHSALRPASARQMPARVLGAAATRCCRVSSRSFKALSGRPAAAAAAAATTAGCTTTTTTTTSSPTTSRCLGVRRRARVTTLRRAQDPSSSGSSGGGGDKDGGGGGGDKNERDAADDNAPSPSSSSPASSSSGGGAGADYVEVKIESVRVSSGASVVYLRIVGDGGGGGGGAGGADLHRVIPVHIGEAESAALLREINRQRQVRPLTHDLMKNVLLELGYRVARVRVTDIIANTYYARVHLVRGGGGGEAPSGGDNTQQQPPQLQHELDVDARPSDAINLAVRFGAPVYVARKIADAAAIVPVSPASASGGGGGGDAGSSSAGGGGGGGGGGESHADIVRSVREALSNYEDPTVMFQLQKELAVKEERFEDARAFQDSIVREMTHNRVLRLVVAMESALADGRYEEAGLLRDEYRRAVADQQAAAAAAAAAEAAAAAAAAQQQQLQQQQQQQQQQEQQQEQQSSSSTTTAADQRKLL